MLLHNQYEFNPSTDLIAKGGFAEVYRAHDHNLNKTVAIKRFVKEAGSAGSVIKEIQKSIDFSHPNIIRYFNCFSRETVDGLGRTITEEYGVMEYANAGSLSDVISGKRKITTEQFKELILGILDGLAYLHSRSPVIIHRDLKPSNILLHEENGELIPKICDFGISKELQGTLAQTTTAAIGTIEYMAPEQIEGKAPSPATDLWALGCIVYEYFNGQPPFGRVTQGASAQQVYWKVMNGKLDEAGMKKVPESFRGLAKGCLVLDVSKRVRSAVEAVLILKDEVKAGQPIAPKDEQTNNSWQKILLFFAAFVATVVIINSIFDQSAITNKRLEIDSPPTINSEEVKPVELDELKTLTNMPNSEVSSQNNASEASVKKLDKFPEAIQKIINHMVYISSGSFMMGCSPDDNECYSDESPRRWITLSTFELGKYEVTQAQWRAVMGSNQSHFKDCDDCPVENVSWNDVQVFIEKLNQMTEKKFRLPTEAEWEFAARGGTTSRFHTGNCLSTQQANFNGNYPVNGCSKGNYGEQTLPVGSFSPNAYGLHDMHGNVSEWCSDWYGTNGSGAQINPKGPLSGANRVIRGGSWSGNGRSCRVSYRNNNAPSDRGYYVGFRLAHD